MFCPSRSGCRFTDRPPYWGINPISPWFHREDYHNTELIVQDGNYMYIPHSWIALADIDEALYHKERQFDLLHRFMDSAWREFGRGIGWDDSLKTCSNSLPEILRSHVANKENGKKYRLKIYLGNNDPPESIRVYVKDRLMTIKAERKTGDENSRMPRTFSSTFPVPQTLDLREVNVEIRPNGVLHVEVPLPQQTMLEHPKPKKTPNNLP